MKAIVARFEFMQAIHVPWKLCMNSCGFKLPGTRRVILRVRQTSQAT